MLSTGTLFVLLPSIHAASRTWGCTPCPCVSPDQSWDCGLGRVRCSRIPGLPLEGSEESEPALPPRQARCLPSPRPCTVPGHSPPAPDRAVLHPGAWESSAAAARRCPPARPGAAPRRAALPAQGRALLHPPRRGAAAASFLSGPLPAPAGARAGAARASSALRTDVKRIYPAEGKRKKDARSANVQLCCKQ